MTHAFFGIIVAAGSGSRFGGETPKQYHSIAGKTILEHTINALLKLDCIAKLVIVLAEDDAIWQKLNIKHPKLLTAQGGLTRAQSTLNGLSALTSFAQANDFVLVHDAARPFVPLNDLEALTTTASSEAAGAILATPVADTLKRIEIGHIEQTIPRTGLYHALTPQCFRFELLAQALKQAGQQPIEVTDDAMAIELLGYKPAIVLGSPLNKKITYPQDIQIFEFLLGEKNDIKT